MILNVDPDSPADRAGLIDSKLIEGDLILGDIIQAINGVPIEDLNDFLDIIEKHKFNDIIKLSIIRKGKFKLEVPLTLTGR